MKMTASEAIEFLLTQPTYAPYAKVLRPIAYQRARETGLINEEGINGGTTKRLDCV